jgi:hypothetical protein
VVDPVTKDHVAMCAVLEGVVVKLGRFFQREELGESEVEDRAVIRFRPTGSTPFNGIGISAFVPLGWATFDEEDGDFSDTADFFSRSCAACSEGEGEKSHGRRAGACRARGYACLSCGEHLVEPVHWPVRVKQPIVS